jgi:hypothetical protein
LTAHLRYISALQWCSYTSNVSAIKSNEQIFPQWFAEHGERFVWADSTPEDDLGEVPFVKTEQADTPDVGTAWFNPPSEISKLFCGTVGNQILAYQMNEVRDEDGLTASDDSYINGNPDGKFPDQQDSALESDQGSGSHKGTQSIFGHYKRPSQPRHFVDDPNASDNHSILGKSKEQIPYLKKGKWKEFSSEKSVKQDKQDQINVDYLIALGLEKEETHNAKREASKLHARLANIQHERENNKELYSQRAAAVPVNIASVHPKTAKNAVRLPVVGTESRFSQT